MLNARSILLGTTIALAISLPGAAHAELSCRDYLRGVQLDAPDVIAQATAIAKPLLQSGWRSMAMVDESVQAVCVWPLLTPRLPSAAGRRT